MQSLSSGYKALVFGATGGIGAAVIGRLSGDSRCAGVVGLSRRSNPAVDITEEASLAEAAAQMLAAHGTFDLIFDATGALAIDGAGPEKSLTALDPAIMARALAINTIGPALLIKHFTPLLPLTGKAVFATLSARVGSIGDNRLGGWYSYRAAKAALNQLVRTASIEIARKRPDAVCLALHPGTVETSLSSRFARGRFTHTPDQAATCLLETVDRTTGADSGSFLAYDGSAIPW